MINVLAIITLMALALFKYNELATEKNEWKSLAEKQKKMLKEDKTNFKRLKVEYSKVYEFANEYPQNFKEEQIQAINEELYQLQGRVVTLEESERKKLLIHAKKYLEGLDENNKA